MKSIALLASALSLTSFVTSRAIGSEPGDGQHELVPRGRGNGGGSSNRRPPVQYIDGDKYDQLSGKPWGPGADSKEYIEQLRTERLPGRIDSGFRPRLSHTPEEGETGFYRRPSQYYPNLEAFFFFFYAFSLPFFERRNGEMDLL